VSPDSNEPYLERVKAEIRAEADAARARAPLPRREPKPASQGLRSDGIDGARLDYALGELTGPHYAAFVDQAFRAVLKRPPDEAGKDAQLRLLAGGASKAEVLGNLRYSPEGRHVGVRVRGLFVRYVLAKLGRVPLVGYFVNWLQALAALPLILVHQRAADTQSAANFDRASQRLDVLDAQSAQASSEREALREDLGRLREELGQLREDHAQLLNAVDMLRNRASALETRAGGIEGRLERELPQLYHYIHTVNHWWMSVKQSLEAIDREAEAANGRAEALGAAIYASPEARDARGKSLAAWVPRFLERAAGAKSLVDLGSGDGERLARIRAAIEDATGVEANPILAAKARERGLNVAVGDPKSWLARSGDASFDAVVASTSLIGPDAASAVWLDGARRVLAANGWLIVDLAGARTDAGTVATLLRAAGFDVEAADEHAVFARRR
jgi:methyltransferase family protein/uncharacterized protein DUF4214